MIQQHSHYDEHNGRLSMGSEIKLHLVNILICKHLFGVFNCCFKRIYLSGVPSTDTY